MSRFKTQTFAEGAAMLRELADKWERGEIPLLVVCPLTHERGGCWVQTPGEPKPATERDVLQARLALAASLHDAEALVRKQNPDSDDDFEYPEPLA